MRNFLKYIVLLFCSSFIFIGCEKDNISNDYIENNPDRLDQVVSDLKKTMVSSEHGWVMMVKTNLNSEVYTPIVLKFDTIKNRVDITTVYGITSDVEDYFRITKGTGSPQLIFSTGSIMSSLYRVGAQASDITDHMYNVKSVSENEIEIQPYRSGNVYAKEGGVVYKLFKRPAEWTWADNDMFFDMTSATFRTNITSVASSLRLEYMNSPTKNRSIATNFSSVAIANIPTMQNGFPFAISRNIGTGGFRSPDYIYINFPYLTTNYNGAAIISKNALSFLPQPAGYLNNATYLTYFVNTFNFHYLVCKTVQRAGNNVKMEFEAYDKEGKVIVKAFYDNLR